MESSLVKQHNHYRTTLKLHAVHISVSISDSLDGNFHCIYYFVNVGLEQINIFFIE